VYPCAGDDEWCVISVRDDADWKRLVRALGSPAWAVDAALSTTEGRLARTADIDRELSEWTAELTPQQVTDRLQAAGVPAGFMRRATDYLDDPHLTARHFFRQLDQPWVDGPVVTENGPCISLGIADPEMRPAPLLGQHTRDLCYRLLSMSEDDIDALFEAGAIEETRAPDGANGHQEVTR
jgi:crotonobetainyl-CoA:carnitine CoA-transferase CaiB-like acyl-CoA transferase